MAVIGAVELAVVPDHATALVRVSYAVEFSVFDVEHDLAYGVSVSIVDGSVTPEMLSNGDLSGAVVTLIRPNGVSSLRDVYQRTLAVPTSHGSPDGPSRDHVRAIVALVPIHTEQLCSMSDPVLVTWPDG